MATKKNTGARSEVVRCRNCGEDYSITYKRCPFCDERAAASRSSDRRGGRRLSNARGGGYGKPGAVRSVATVLSVLLIIAAIAIVVKVIRPLVSIGAGELPAATSAPPAASFTPAPEVSPSPVTPAPAVTPAPVTPAPVVTPAPAQGGATSFTLNQSDFTIAAVGERYTLRPTFFPAGSEGTITWTSANPAVVTVDGSGKVTATGRGHTTVTATMGSVTQTCIVRCRGGAAPSPTPDSSASALSLNRTDFTLGRAGEKFTLKVSGTASTPTWSIGKSSVATISATGVVTAVAGGTTTATCQVDGQTLTCTVRCGF